MQGSEHSNMDSESPNPQNLASVAKASVSPRRRWSERAGADARRKPGPGQHGPGGLFVAWKRLKMLEDVVQAPATGLASGSVSSARHQ